MTKRTLTGAGLGLRRSFLEELAQLPDADLPDFLEIAPENWIGLGGRYAAALRPLTERLPFACHGLSLSIGGQRPLDLTFLQRLRQFLDQHGISLYSEHLSFSGDDGHLYDLLPIPFTEAAVRHVAGRVRQVQDILQRRIALENVSYYAAPGAEMSELEFVNGVLEQADCDLLLDVNNIYVNSINHGYDPVRFMQGLPTPRIACLHIAGHLIEAEDLRIDTHGDAVAADVWTLLAQTYRQHGVRPTLLERDFNIPPLDELLAEVAQIRAYQAQAGQPREQAS